MRRQAGRCCEGEPRVVLKPPVDRMEADDEGWVAPRQKGVGEKKNG